jgi:hypothetical protein
MALLNYNDFKDMNESLKNDSEDSINEGILGTLLSFIPGTDAKKVKGLSIDIIKLKKTAIRAQYDMEKKVEDTEDKTNIHLDIPKLKRITKDKVDALNTQAEILSKKIDEIEKNANNVTKKFIAVVKLNTRLNIAKEREKFADEEEKKTLAEDIKELEEKIKAREEALGHEEKEKSKKKKDKEESSDNSKNEKPKEGDDKGDKPKEKKEKSDDKKDKSKDDDVVAKNDEIKNLEDALEKKEKEFDKLKFDIKENPELEHDNEFKAKFDKMSATIAAIKFKIKKLKNSSDEEE